MERVVLMKMQSFLPLDLTNLLVRVRPGRWKEMSLKVLLKYFNRSKISASKVACLFNYSSSKVTDTAL